MKCKHEGQAPCRGCLKSNSSSTCVLSGPVLTRRADDGSRRQTPKRKSQVEVHSNASPKRQKGEAENDASVELFKLIPREEHAEALSIFQAQFPEFGFIHPIDYDLEAEKIDGSHAIRLLAIFAVASRYFNSTAAPLARDCASLVTKKLQQHITSPSGIHLIQTYLIMALYEWGEGEGFSAWMYSGIAARMAQGSLLVRTPVNGAKPLSEVERRTIWTCFVMDKLLSCGRQRPAMFRLTEMDLSLPLTHEDFVFDIGSIATTQTGRDKSAEQEILKAGDHFQIILKGVDIWSRVHSWIVEGGRKRPSMSEPQNYPWLETSEWSRMKSELQRWRNAQDSRLKYPEAKVAAHAHLRRGEIFGYINLIYYARCVGTEPLPRCYY